MMRFTVSLLLGLLPFTASAAERLVTTAEGDEIPVTVHAVDGDRLVLWLPSEFGATQRRTALAKALATNGIEVWTPYLHTAWFLHVWRHSLNNIDPAAIGALIAEATRRSDRDVYLMAEGRTAALALRAVRHWQQATDVTVACVAC